MKWNQLYPWFTGEMFIYLLLNLIMLGLVHHLGVDFSQVLMSPVMLVLLGLATYRGANIFANEIITKPIRAPFVECRMEDGKEKEVPREHGLRGAVGCLICCPSCVGVWVAPTLLYALVLLPDVATVVIAILALSGVERIISLGLEGIRKT